MVSNVGPSGRYHERHGTGVIERSAHRQHREDQRQQPSLDEGKRLVGVDAAGQQHDGHGDDGERQDRGHVEAARITMPAMAAMAMGDFVRR
jgi:hypothetical protein